RVFGAGDELRVAEVVAHVGEFLELRTVAAEPTQVCTAGGVDPSFELRFFALPDELEWVLGKPKQVEFEDGTRLEFAAGVPILRRGPDLMLQVGAAEFLVPLADHEIATWFRPERLDDESTHASWRHGRPLYYGDQQITGTDDPPFRTAIAKQIIEGGALLSFAGACGRFTLRSEGDDHLANAGLYS